MNHSIFAAAAALSLIAAPASAITSYVTTFDYTPDGRFSTSSDPADGNRIVVEWSTAVMSGTVGADDLDDLSFTLFGDDGVGGFVEIFRDNAIIGGVGQPIAGLGRTVCGTDPCNIEFDFDIDACALDPTAGTIRFNNHNSFATAGANGTYYGFTLASTVSADLFVDADDVSAGSTFNADFEVSTTVQPIPLPAPALMLLSALGAAAFAARRKRG
ncbi:MAG: hypothetical protein AAF684_03905 [Pseudomonadota bacterium]